MFKVAVILICCAEINKSLNKLCNKTIKISCGIEDFICHKVFLLNPLSVSSYEIVGFYGK